MRRIAVAVTLLLLLGAAVVRADRWVSGKTLPKPIDFPIVRKNVKEYHKPGKKQNHPPAPIGNYLEIGSPISRA